MDNSKTIIKIPQTSPNIDQTDFDAIIKPLKNGWITEGPKSEDFIKKLKEIIGVPYGVLVPNGTLALGLSMMALGIGPEDEVLVPDTTFIGSATSVIFSGGKPIFVDVEPVTFQIDVRKAEKMVTSKTKAIMPVHLFGTAANMDEIVNFAQKNNLLIIEDAAQAIGVEYKGKHVGSFGAVGCFSFFADKTITTGEGGFVACNDKTIYDKLNLLRNQGREKRGTFIHPEIGYNFRMTDIQAALGLNQLKKLDFIVKRKQILFNKYQEQLSDVKEVRLLGPSKDSTHVPFRAVLMVQNATQLTQFLNQNGIETRSFFYPLHKQPCFLENNKLNQRYLNDSNYLNANYGYDHGICLPISPSLSLDDIMYITDKIKIFYRRCETV